MEEAVGDRVVKEAGDCGGEGGGVGEGVLEEQVMDTMLEEKGCGDCAKGGKAAGR